MESKSKSRWISKQSITPQLCHCQLKRLLCASALQLGDRFIMWSSIYSQLPSIKVFLFERDTLGGKFHCASTRIRVLRTFSPAHVPRCRTYGRQESPQEVFPCQLVFWMEKQHSDSFIIHCLWLSPFYRNIIILPICFFLKKKIWFICPACNASHWPALGSLAAPGGSLLMEGSPSSAAADWVLLAHGYK